MLGAKLVMETGLYGGISSATTIAPEGDALERVHLSYIEMAQAGRVTEDQRQTFFAAGEWMHRELGAEAVVLGGTDLFLAFEGGTSYVIASSLLKQWQADGIHGL
jgi:aspartate racemase